MTLLTDIAALTVLLVTLSFVPVLGLRHEARITRDIREADRAGEEEITRARRLRADSPASAAARVTNRSTSGV